MSEHGVLKLQYKDRAAMTWNNEDKQIMDILIEDYGIDGIMEELAKHCDTALLQADNEVYRVYGTALWQLLGGRNGD